MSKITDTLDELDSLISDTSNVKEANLHTITKSETPGSMVIKQTRRKITTTSNNIPTRPDAGRSSISDDVFLTIPTPPKTPNYGINWENRHNNTEIYTSKDRKKEVEQRIMQADGLKIADLNKTSMISTLDGIIQIEYQCIANNFSYVYAHKNCKEPRYSVRIAGARYRLPLPSHNSTILIRVLENGGTEEIHRWEEE